MPANYDQVFSKKGEWIETDFLSEVKNADPRYDAYRHDAYRFPGLIIKEKRNPYDDNEQMQIYDAE